jgi:hypothetical protein
MASEIIVTIRIKPWWLALLRLAVAIRFTSFVVWLAEHPAVEVSA